MRNVLLLPAGALCLLLVACPPSRDPGTGGSGDPPVTGDFGTCDPGMVLDQTCPLVAIETFVLEGWCEFGQGLPQVFRTADEWRTFLELCDTDIIDPIGDLDWGAFDVIGTTAQASGCNASAGTLWLADCASTQHLAYWSIGCGFCDAIWTTTHFATVEAGVVEELVLETCVPEGEECVDEGDG